MSISQITELREKRAALIAAQRSALDAVDSESRSLTGEEAADFDKRDGEIDGLTAEINRREKFAAVQSSVAIAAEATRETATVVESGSRHGSEEYRDVVVNYLRTGDDSGFEKRDLSVGTTTAGGFTVPTLMFNEIVQVMRDFGVMRQLARVITTGGGEPVQIPKVTAFGASGWTNEAAAFTESDPTFAQASLGAYKATHIAQISEELLQDSAFDVEGLITDIMGQNLGVLTNTAYVVGDGSSKPTGITTQTSAGKTGTTGQTTSVITDDLIDLFHSILPAYRRNGSWLMNDSSVKVVRKLKDTTNQYLWQPGLTAGAPDMLLGKPVYADPDMPVMAANAKSILFGDFSNYWIRDAGGMQMQRLVELYAGTGQVGFRAFLRTDGKLIDTTAVKHYANSAT